MRTVTYNLIQFLTEAKRGAFVIPRFQRPFVWNNAQVKLLIDSIARNYPIGSLLLLQETIPESPFLSSRKIDAVIGESEDSTESEEDASLPAFPPAVYYVLDGQQRLTSLVRVFLQASRESTYYFDLEELLESGPNDKNSTTWVVRRNPDRNLSTRYIRSDIITEDEKCSIWVQEYFESSCKSLKGDRSAQRKAVAKVNKVFETMRNYQVPLVIIDRGDSTEAICRIFETINSTGTRLTTFDLAVARFFPTPDLHELWQQSKVKFPVLEKFSAEGERVLQIVAITTGYEQRSYVEPTRSSLLSLTANDILLHWEFCSESLAKAYDWVERHGATPSGSSSDALLVPLAYFLGKTTPTWKSANPGNNIILERWYFSHSLQQGARQASNYKIAQAVAGLHKWMTEGIPPEIPKVHINHHIIQKLAKSDARHQAILKILKWKNNKDLWTGEELSTDEVEDHHIFPAALAKREKLPRRLLDSATNRLLISKSTNRFLNDRIPRDYIGSLLREAETSGVLPAKIEHLQLACLPTEGGSVNEIIDGFDVSQIHKFMEIRSKLILKLISMILGDSLITEELPEEPEDQD